MLYSLLRHLMFLLPPEWSDDVGLYGLQALHTLGLSPLLCRAPPNSEVSIMGLTFKNKVGIAAGLDVNGDFMHALASLGVGHIEVGGVTPKPQVGNPSPWLFRLPKQQAIINRKGFRNKGVDYLVKNLAKKPKQCLIGVNITKNKDTPLADAFADYAVCMEKLNAHADYIAINISSPNTPGLRELQSEQYLTDLLAQCKDYQQQLPKYVPLVVKISPDMDDEQLAHLAKSCLANQIDGIIATNTTISRDAIAGAALANEQGGLSGAPLRERATQVISTLNKLIDQKIPIIGCGGIITPVDGKEKFNAGASLVQVYTGLIYTGPSLITAMG